MTPDGLKSVIEAAWEDRDTISPATVGEVRDAIEAALDGLDSGELRVAEKSNGAMPAREAFSDTLMDYSRRLPRVLSEPGLRSVAPITWTDSVEVCFLGAIWAFAPLAFASAH